MTRFMICIRSLQIHKNTAEISAVFFYKAVYQTLKFTEVSPCLLEPNT